MLLAICTLWARDIVRFYRQRSRIVGALGTPIVFWLLLGSGLGSSFRAGSNGQEYLEYFYPGTLALIVLFHGHLLDDLGHRRPAGGIPSGRSGRAGPPHRDRHRQGPRRRDARDHAIGHLGGGRAGRRYLPELGETARAGVGADGLGSCLDRVGIRAGLVARFHTRVSCHHEPAAGSDVDAVRRRVSGRRRRRLDSAPS